MSDILYSWGAKVLLPLLIPVVVTALKQVIDHWTPIALGNVPKPLWGALAILLGALPTLVSPEMFLLPGFPPEVSAALYGVTAMGVREIVDQSIKVIGPAPTTPSGI